LLLRSAEIKPLYRRFVRMNEFLPIPLFPLFPLFPIPFPMRLSILFLYELHCPSCGLLVFRGPPQLWWLCSTFFRGSWLFDLKFENSEEGGMQSSELRWTFRDQEVATEERGATVSKWELLGHPPKKAICACGGGGGTPGSSRVCMAKIWKLWKKKNNNWKLTSFKVPAVLDRATGCKSRLLCHPNWGFLGLQGPIRLIRRYRLRC